MRKIFITVPLFASGMPFEALMESADGRVLQWFTAIDGFFESSGAADPANFEGDLNHKSGVLVCKTKSGESPGRYVMKQTYAWTELMEQILRDRSKMCAKLAQVAQADTSPVVAVHARKIKPVRGVLKNPDGCFESHIEHELPYEICANGLLKISDPPLYIVRLAEKLSSEEISRVDDAISKHYMTLKYVLSIIDQEEKRPKSVLTAEPVLRSDAVKLCVTTDSPSFTTRMAIQFKCTYEGKIMSEFNYEYLPAIPCKPMGTRAPTHEDVAAALPGAQKTCKQLSFLITRIEPLSIIAHSGLQALLDLDD